MARLEAMMEKLLPAEALAELDQADFTDDRADV